MICDDRLVEFARAFLHEWKRVGGGTALSHKEGRHHLLSGARFVRPLLRATNRKVMAKLVLQWAPFFEVARVRKDCGLGAIQRMYNLSKGRMLLAITKAKGKERPLYAGGYNAMEVTRAATNVLEALGAKRLKYSDSVHELMCKHQRAESRLAMKSYFASADSVKEFLAEAADDDMNWTTVQVLVCETRQVKAALGEDEVRKTLRWARESPSAPVAVRKASARICSEGAKGSDCFMLRLFKALRGSAVADR
jgi:hypothetical protein